MSKVTIGPDFSLNHYLCLPDQHIAPDGARTYSVPYAFGNPMAGILRSRISAPSSSIEQQSNTGANSLTPDQISQLISGSIE